MIQDRVKRVAGRSIAGQWLYRIIRGLVQPVWRLWRYLRHRRARSALLRDPWVHREDGVRLLTDPDDPRAWTLRVSRGVMDERLSGVWRHLIEELDPDVLVDVGANYGEFTLSPNCSRRTHVFAYEPNPNVADCLRQSVGANDARVEVVEAAVGSGDAAEACLYLGEHSGLATLAEAGSAHAIRVKSTTLTAQHMSDGYRSALIKIDVEGYELAALRGARAWLDALERYVIVLEAHHLSRSELEEISGFGTVVGIDFGRSAVVSLAEWLEARDRTFLGKDLFLVSASEEVTLHACLARWCRREP